jgi:murein L,D-transpeptidase YcbB/YkuD
MYLVEMTGKVGKLMPVRWWLLGISFLFCFLASGEPAVSALLDGNLATPIRSAIAGKAFPVRGIRGNFHPALAPFYEERGFAPAWLRNGDLSHEASAFIEHLRTLSDEGLCPEDYRLSDLEAMLLLRRNLAEEGKEPDNAWRAGMDLLLTDGFLTLADDLTRGRVNPRQVHDAWNFVKKAPEPLAVLRSALEHQDVVGALDALRPLSPAYKKLKEALRQYRVLAAQGGWPAVPDGPVLHRGEKDARIPLLRRRLAASGDLRKGAVTSAEILDTPLQRALLRFQWRHGLGGDGVLGPRTLKELNVTVEERIRQIEVNLERWRWLPRDLGKRYLQVNIPDMMLTVVEHGAPVLWMPVVIGQAVRETPVFAAQMTYIQFSPYWYVPPTILREDKLAKIKKDPGWLTRNHFDLIPFGNQGGETLDPAGIDWEGIDHKNFPGILRQRPGPWNPLGRVKFMFPNDHAIYLHDTDQPWLFFRNRRLFSSGCIRIQRPLDLAQYLLEGQGWSCEELMRAMDLDSPRLVWLPEPLPVYLLYLTAWMDEEGEVQFRRDLYYKDLALDYLLARHSTLRGNPH